MATAKPSKGRKAAAPPVGFSSCPNCGQRRSRALPFEYMAAFSMKWIGIMAIEAAPVLACWVAYFPASAILPGIVALSCLGITSYRLWADERNQSTN
jgi:hypothetical protein